MKLTSINIVIVFAIALISIMAIASITSTEEETRIEPIQKIALIGYQPKKILRIRIACGSL